MDLFSSTEACFEIVAQLGIYFEQAADKNELIMENQMIFVRVATLNDAKYAAEIAKETEESAIARGSGISKRSPESLVTKMREGKAVIAVTGIGEWVGFSYFEVWEGGAYVSNSGLIVAPKFRNAGVAKAIKERVFRISRRMYPEAKVFSITSGAAIMKLNSRLGFEPVSFAEITQDNSFWEGCKSCVNYDILENKKRCNCLCTAMLFDPQKEKAELAAEKRATEELIMVLDCVAYPRHSLVPDAMGTNALCTALTDIKWFNEYVFPIEGNLPNPVKMKVSGGLYNFTVEISYDHSYTAKEILNVIKNHTWCKFTVRKEAFKLPLTDDGVYKDCFVSNNY
ncbi:zinc-binding metallopeptidase family protein [Pedobacter hiemivivus]|uniref:hypothetical protein n=1 Tax=Pedobacter hiemivivus TaxID=2530454 RepID=UPI0019816FEC|nr:hypothetical protein [Pedobacter hiemivivus]